MYIIGANTIHKSIRKLSVFLILLLVFCSGCGNKNDIPENKEESSKQEIADDIDMVAETDIEEQNTENLLSAKEEVPKEEAATEETIETIEAPAEEDTLCVGIAKEIFEGTNNERIVAGLPALEWSDELALAADIRAEEIIDCFSHVRPDGTKCYALGDRIHGENIAKAPPQSTGAEFMQHWMESQGHKENILREQFTMMGVGTRTTDMGITAVQIFGY